MSNLKEISSSNYDAEVLKSKGLVLVDFWAPWCGPCRMQTPILEKLSQSSDSNISIAKLNTDDNPAIAQQLGIASIPTLILFKDGKEVDRYVGVQPEETLRQNIKKHS
jgi:thioredoxin 1